MPNPSGSEFSRRQLLQRAAALAVLAGPAAGVLSACAGGGGTGPAQTGAKSTTNPFGVVEDAPLDVVLFDGGFGKDYAQYDLNLYTKAFPKSKAALSTTQKISDQLQPRFANGTPPDVIDDSGDNQIKPGTLVNSNALTDLGQLLDAPSYDDPNVKVRDTLLPGVLNIGTYNNKVYLLNYSYTVYGIWYNKKLFDAKGWTPPKTWDEFKTLAPQIKAAGIAPWVHAGKYPYYQGVPIMDWIGKAGGNQVLIDIDNLKPNAWRVDAVKASLNAVLEMVHNGWVLPGAEGMTHIESQQAFLDGKAAFIPVGSWFENEMRKTIPQGTELTLIPMPDLTSSDKLPYGTLRAEAGEPFVVPAKAKNQAGGLEFLRVMLSKDAATNFAKVTSSLSIVKGSADSVTTSTALTSANKAVQAAGTNLVTYRSVTDWYPTLINEWQAATGELMAGRFTADQWIDKVQAAADKVAADSSIEKFHRDK
ncbi:N-acetylglucosamine/diacetylchitobiose ABC transporter substrate-binding protein [Kutzneria sp. CA-103260]|uniref:N-acetylglucosamine/diacetylchitobiose ABC transporter substrate-binding protein n=1 Tax=Kutzneria sp. CA-103260 TaxID=2802641 RepID=UPI001BAB8BB9|nr:N-acetylglucosamine/diacetylchitobiose ABC transporter substrate-binding protein [Kutzneria sp. CA-103260]QUQ71357.1 carbohydrate ABC transporter, N-acetylglucosamine/diacetylchitobiose-binding protein [Kutzneria sp. CA-103260]